MFMWDYKGVWKQKRKIMISKLLYQVRLRRHLKTMDSGLNYMEDIWYEIYEKALTKKQGCMKANQQTRKGHYV